MAPQQLDLPARDRLIGGLPLLARRIDVNGIATAILEGGKGAPVVLLHGGIQAGGAVWWRVAPQLTASYRVIVPDLPGLGASEPAGQLNLDTVDAWLAGVLRLTGHEPATLVAHSAPGGMAARFAAGHGHLLRRLVLVDAAGLGRFRPSPRFLAALIWLNLRPSTSNFERFMRQVLDDLDATRNQDPHWEDFADYIVALAPTPQVKQAMRQLIKAGTRRLTDTDLPHRSVPTTLIWGRDDPLIPLQHAEAAAEQHGWPLRIIDHAGHLPHVEQPDAFVASLTDAINAH